ncbi:nidogen-2-like [Paramacrobiotus metropolitanus]|uniref:nidogen-2-like n=1 Tax=Paramacrobiotus metropolitanus TaxID=2943436 RepID=UPI0024462316|nr:nidogen-2-like [Paramacrobiotus metropolitanus]
MALSDVFSTMLSAFCLFLALCSSNSHCLDVLNNSSSRATAKPDSMSTESAPTDAGILVYSRGNSVMKLPLDNISSGPEEMVSLIYQIALGMAVDCQERFIYWSDLEGPTINRVRFDGTDRKVVLDRDSVYSGDGLAIDPISRTLFWTDATHGHIACARLNDTEMQAKILIADNLSSPGSIAVHPSKGLIFWADWDSSQSSAPKIEVARMDGSERRTIVSSNLMLPHALTVDLDTDEICWADAGTHNVECASLDGSNRSIVVAADSSISPFRMTVYRGVLYWTDWARDNILSVHKDGAGESTITSLLPSGSPGTLHAVTAVSRECFGFGAFV